MEEVPAFKALNFSVKLKVVCSADSMAPTTRMEPAPPFALVPLTNSKAEESYSSITSEAPNGSPLEDVIFMFTET